jgi:hypothetical protein
LNRILVAFFLLVPTISKADGQDFLVLVSDIFDFLFVFSIWALGILFLFLTLNAFGKGVFNKKKRLSIWIVGLLLAFFHWTMIKHDPYPYSGPIDSFVHKDKLEKSRTIDSLELMNGKTDSTIEATIASLDSNEVGVYIWLNHKKYFVRKLTAGLNQRQQDSLTMSTVRSWTKK